MLKPQIKISTELLFTFLHFDECVQNELVCYGDGRASESHFLFMVVSDTKVCEKEFAFEYFTAIVP